MFESLTHGSHGDSCMIAALTELGSREWLEGSSRKSSHDFLRIGRCRRTIVTEKVDPCDELQKSESPLMSLQTVSPMALAWG